MATKEKKQFLKPRSAKATVKFVRIAPRKVRPVINVIRYQNPEIALRILSGVTKKAARLVEKLVKTAIANAKVLGLDETRLTISDIRADGGPMMKRFIERSMGRGDRILKRTTHLSVIVSEGQKKFEGTGPQEAQLEQAEGKKASKSEKAGREKKSAAAKA